MIAVAVVERHGPTQRAVALAWMLRKPAVDGAIVDFRRLHQVGPIMAASKLELSEGDIAAIEWRA
jgi:aryl-alcohol dehydrogenase-like predicted oxidoreductase